MKTNLNQNKIKLNKNNKDTPAVTNLPYRPNVGAMIFNHKGQIFVGLRHDLAKEGIWSFPQGGIDKGENPEQALYRELQDELGCNQFTILDEYPEWLSYDLPPHLIGKSFGGKYRGQTQKWFAVRFSGKDEDIRFDMQKEQEFDDWKWIALSELSNLKTGFKHDLYEKLAKYFASYAVS